MARLPSTPRNGRTWAINEEVVGSFSGTPKAARIIDALIEAIADDANASKPSEPHDTQKMYEHDSGLIPKARGGMRARGAVWTNGQHAANSEAIHKTLAKAAVKRRGT